MDSLQAELQDIRFPDDKPCPMASDSLGNLYVSSPDGHIWKCGLRSNLLDSSRKGGDASQQGRSSKSRADFIEICPRPAVDFAISQLSISPDGSHAIVAGIREDGEELSIAVLDLTESQSSRRHTKYSYVSRQVVDDVLFSNRPGLELLQISWHPESLRHFVVLTSDNVLRVYCLDNLASAEQSFALHLEPERGLGILDYDLQNITAFAFARGDGWEKYTIYLVSNQGNIYMLCPVAPFGSRYHAYTAENMMALVSNEDAESLASTAWLQQAMPACIVGSGETGLPSPSSGMQEMHRVQPHALSDHTVSLQGPLAVASPDPDLCNALDLRRDEDTASCLCYTWYNEHCSVLTLASQGGAVAWHLIAHSPRPEWCERPPNCSLSDDQTILAVKNEVSVSESWNGELLLIAAADLVLEQSEEDGRLESLPQLWPDPSTADRWYFVHQNNAFVLSAPWTTRLAYQLITGKEVDIQAEISQSSVEELWAESSGMRKCLGSTPVGGQLTSSCIMILLSDGQLKTLRPTQLHLENVPSLKAENAVEEVTQQIAAIYGDIFCGPRKIELPPGSHVGVQQPEGQKLLALSIKILREKFVEFLHQAHHEMDTRFSVTEQGLEKQAGRSSQIEKAMAAIQQKQQLLDQRLQQCDQWNSNLTERINLLTELHWARPHPLSNAETAFQKTELPRLTAQMKTLSFQIKGLKSESQQLGDNDTFLHGTGVNKIPVSQMRAMRSALLEQSEIIAKTQELLASVESDLDE